MKVNKMFKNNYLKATDLETDETFTVKKLEMQSFEGVEKPVLYFEEMDPGLILNKTNARTIAGLYGQESDSWLGKRITVFGCGVDFKGESVLAVRVRKEVPFAGADPGDVPF